MNRGGEDRVICRSAAGAMAGRFSVAACELWCLYSHTRACVSGAVQQMGKVELVTEKGHAPGIDRARLRLDRRGIGTGRRVPSS